MSALVTELSGRCVLARCRVELRARQAVRFGTVDSVDQLRQALHQLDRLLELREAAIAREVGR